MAQANQNIRQLSVVTLAEVRAAIPQRTRISTPDEVICARLNQWAEGFDDPAFNHLHPDYTNVQNVARRFRSLLPKRYWLPSWPTHATYNIKKGHRNEPYLTDQVRTPLVDTPETRAWQMERAPTIHELSPDPEKSAGVEVADLEIMERLLDRIEELEGRVGVLEEARTTRASILQRLDGR